MAKTIKYIGNQDNWFEVAVTGKQSCWQVGQQEERSDTESAQLLATGLFQQMNLPAVLAATDPLTGGMKNLIGPDGKDVEVIDEQTTPIVCIGGDHQYLQWWGTNGNNGMFSAYEALGLPTYVAICWDGETNSSGNREASFSDVNGKPAQFMSLQQALQLQSRGLEFVAHGSRHPNQWDVLNSGIRIDYLGAAGSATVLINGNGTVATDIVFVGNGGAENTTLTLSSYATLNDLKAAIDGIAGGGKWLCQIAQELAGTEDPKWLWPIAAARTVTGGTAPYNNRRFCIAGGVKFQYTGSTYKFCTVYVGTAGTIKIFLDGVRAATFSPTTQSLATMLSSINTAVTTTFGASGFSAVLMDNGPNTVQRESYMSGDELATYLTRGVEDCAGRPARMTYGYSWRYVVRRQFENLLVKAAAAGIKIKNMAQAGANLPTISVSDLPFNEWRLEPTSFAMNPCDPYPLPANLDTPWHTVSTIASNRTLPEFKAAIDAVCDSGPFAVDWLIHKVLPDGSSGYQFPTDDLTYYDMTESDFVAAAQYLAAKKAAGLVDVKSPEQFRIARRKRQKPRNLVFNPRFINREQYGGTALLGCTTAAQGANGFAVSGWQCNFPSGAGNLSAVSVAGGRLSIVTNGAVSAGFAAIRHACWLERGKEYDLGFDVDASGLTAGSVQIVLRAQRLRPRGAAPQTATPGVAGRTIYAGTQGTAAMRFVPEAADVWTPERVMSKVGPFNLGSSPSHLKINYNGIGTSADINVAGATPTATTAKEIATAINAAIAADAAYATKPEYHGVARAEGGRVIIEGPYRNLTPHTSGISITGGTTNGQLSTIFGGAEVLSYGTPSGAEDAGHCQYWLEVFVATGTNGTIVISAPFAKEVTSG